MSKYFAYCPNGGFETFTTIEARDAWAKEAIELHLDDGWSEDVEFVCVGEITAKAVQCNVQPRPARTEFASDQEYEDAIADWGGDPTFDSICNYELRALRTGLETRALCPHGYEQKNLADGTDTCSGCDELNRLPDQEN